MRQNSSTVLMHLQTQLPICFLQLLTIVVYSFIFQAIVVSASVIALGIKTENESMTATGYLTLVSMCFVFMSLLEIYRQVHDPLGDQASDFPKAR